MTRPRNSTYLSAEDLAWFSLDNYAPLRRAPVNIWLQVIYDRASLKQLLETGQGEKVAELFNQLKLNPLTPLGFSQIWTATHPCNTSSVRLMTLNRVKGLVSILSDENGHFEAPGESAVDQLYLDRGYAPIPPIAHMTVDLSATDKQLCADFMRWLDAWRDHANIHVTNGDYQETKLPALAALGVVPYFDLSFYAELVGGNISRETFTELLSLSDRGARARLDDLRNRVNDIVSFQTAATIRAASAE